MESRPSGREYPLQGQLSSRATGRQGTDPLQKETTFKKCSKQPKGGLDDEIVQILEALFDHLWPKGI